MGIEWNGTIGEYRDNNNERRCKKKNKKEVMYLEIECHHISINMTDKALSKYNLKVKMKARIHMQKRITE